MGEVLISDKYEGLLPPRDLVTVLEEDNLSKLPEIVKGKQKPVVVHVGDATLYASLKSLQNGEVPIVVDPDIHALQERLNLLFYYNHSSNAPPSIKRILQGRDHPYDYDHKLLLNLVNIFRSGVALKNIIYLPMKIEDVKKNMSVLDRNFNVNRVTLFYPYPDASSHSVIKSSLSVARYLLRDEREFILATESWQVANFVRSLVFHCDFYTESFGDRKRRDPLLLL